MPSCWMLFFKFTSSKKVRQAQGVQVGILIDPDTQTLRVYRSEGLSKNADSGEPILQVTTLRDGDTLAIPELFPGLEISITSLWPPVYE
jgi:Uma2 family endonuclease